MKSASQNVLKYDAIFEEQEVGGYTVTVPMLPGCISEGDTFEEAKGNIEDAIKLYLEDLEAEGEDFPIALGTSFIGQIEVAMPHLSL